MAAQGMDLVLTSGGLGPTADDLTARSSASFQGREMVLDEALEQRIAEIVRPLMTRWPNLDVAAIEPGTRKQATIPRGRDRARAGRHGARAWSSRPASGAQGRRSSCCPARRASCSRCGRRRCRRGALRAALARRDELPPAHAAAVRHARVGDRRDAARGRARGRRARSPGDNHLPETRRDRGRHALRARRRGSYEAFARLVAERHADTLFSDDGSTVDEQVAALLRGAARSPPPSPAPAACWRRA